MARKAHSGAWLAENWIALIAIVISVSSLAVSVNQCEDTELHDQPRFQYTYFYDATGAGWKLMNSGLGPARLRGFKMAVDGKAITDFNDLWDALGLPQPRNFQFTNPRIGDLYAAGHENILFWANSGPGADILRNTWTKLTIQVCYCSIHDHCWLSDSSVLPNANGDPRDDKCSTFIGQEHNRWWSG
jgi:hypothetical protein